MKLNRWRTNNDTVRVVLDEKEARRILAEAVAKEAGIALSEKQVDWRAYFSTSDSSTGHTTQCTVEIVVDLLPAGDGDRE